MQIGYIFFARLVCERAQTHLRMVDEVMSENIMSFLPKNRLNDLMAVRQFATDLSLCSLYILPMYLSANLEKDIPCLSESSRFLISFAVQDSVLYSASLAIYSLICPQQLANTILSVISFRLFMFDLCIKYDVLIQSVVERADMRIYTVLNSLSVLVTGVKVSILSL